VIGAATHFVIDCRGFFQCWLALFAEITDDLPDT
jgi:hypothetical protein